MASSEGSRAPPLRLVPGSYGLPVIGAVRDRLDFYHFHGQDKYFESRVDRYGSTVVRINVPPGPFMARDPRVVALLDAKSFPVLFDVTKVEKKNVVSGTYMPPPPSSAVTPVCSSAPSTRATDKSRGTCRSRNKEAGAPTVNAVVVQDTAKDAVESPMSVQERWFSERSSPSRLPPPCTDLEQAIAPTVQVSQS